MKKRIGAILLIFAICAGGLAACTRLPEEEINDSGVTEPAGTVVSGNEEDETPAWRGSLYGSAVAKDTGGLEARDVDSNGYQNDRLPNGLDYQGKEVQILGWDNEADQTIPRSDSRTDAVASALYWHWKGIEERLNVRITVTYTDSDYPGRSTFLAKARAENANYDLIQTQSLFPIVLANEGRLCNLANLNYPELAMPWWSDSLQEWILDGSMYFICSNSSAMSLSNLAVIYSHTALIEEKGLETPISLTLSGKWTLEKMNEISQAFAAEAALVGDEQCYGLVVDDSSRLGALYYACGFSSVVKNRRGEAQIGFDEEWEWQAIGGAIAKLEGMFTDGSVVIHSSDTFTEMQSGQTAMLLGYWQFMRELNGNDYEVVPMPMLDEEQYTVQGYRSVHRDYVDTWCIPTTASDKNLSGMILEASASSEYRSVAPVWCRLMQERYRDAEQGKQVIQILRNSIIYDVGRAAQEKGVGAEGYWADCFRGGYDNKFQSSCQYVAEVFSINLRKILKTFRTYREQ